MKRRAVIYALEAVGDLDRIYDIIAEASSAITADRYDQRIRAFCERLEYGSERGTRRDDVRQELRIIGFGRRVTIAFIGLRACGDFARVLRRGRLAATTWPSDAC
ncbi:type II toxin-antitoxin system RelE/ParE family toxin [Mesorhizobium sp.]|uniref:type II toxin-antitoxin system RelE/ParE family toxin n=1 Tax=Mesorhizobium sp. TaxID=1871066 RepID=UPI00344F13F5